MCTNHTRYEAPGMKVCKCWRKERREGRIISVGEEIEEHASRQAAATAGRQAGRQTTTTTLGEIGCSTRNGQHTQAGRQAGGQLTAADNTPPGRTDRESISTRGYATYHYLWPTTTAQRFTTHAERQTHATHRLATTTQDLILETFPIVGIVRDFCCCCCCRDW